MQETSLDEDVISNGKRKILHNLGTLDWNIYGCITDKHITGDIVITDEQLLHIRDKHPDAYPEVIRYLRNTLDDPDYILRDKRPNTGIVIKRVLRDKNNILLAVRICTSEDKQGYKNSVITSWKIAEKRLENYLRNKEVIYKKE